MSTANYIELPDADLQASARACRTVLPGAVIAYGVSGDPCGIIYLDDKSKLWIAVTLDAARDYLQRVSERQEDAYSSWCESTSYEAVSRSSAGHALVAAGWGPTERQLVDLGSQAAAARDYEAAALAARALEGNEVARISCAMIINEARSAR